MIYCLFRQESYTLINLSMRLILTIGPIVSTITLLQCQCSPLRFFIPPPPKKNNREKATLLQLQVNLHVHVHVKYV